jgi:signal transduction histidine kinase
MEAAAKEVFYDAALRAGARCRRSARRHGSGHFRYACTAMRGTICTALGPPYEAQGHASLDQTTLELAVAGITFAILAVASIVSLSERKRAEEALRRARANLAHINRVTTMGELTASLAHEVNQPIAAAVTNANACLRWLTEHGHAVLRRPRCQHASSGDGGRRPR